MGLAIVFHRSPSGPSDERVHGSDFDMIDHTATHSSAQDFNLSDPWWDDLDWEAARPGFQRLACLLDPTRPAREDVAAPRASESEGLPVQFSMTVTRPTGDWMQLSYHWRAPV